MSGRRRGGAPIAHEKIRLRSFRSAQGPPVWPPAPNISSRRPIRRARPCGLLHFGPGDLFAAAASRVSCLRSGRAPCQISALRSASSVINPGGATGFLPQRPVGRRVLGIWLTSQVPLQGGAAEFVSDTDLALAVSIMRRHASSLARTPPGAHLSPPPHMAHRLARCSLNARENPDDARRCQFQGHPSAVVLAPRNTSSAPALWVLVWRGSGNQLLPSAVGFVLFGQRDVKSGVPLNLILVGTSRITPGI